MHRHNGAERSERERAVIEVLLLDDPEATKAYHHSAWFHHTVTRQAAVLVEMADALTRAALRQVAADEDAAVRLAKGERP